VWAKYPGNPVMDVGPPGSFDERWVLPDKVIVRAGYYQAWYWAADGFESGDTAGWTVTVP
jgi:hypothetical protein